MCDGVVNEQDYTISYKNSVMNVGLDNLDLERMVNGYDREPLKLKHSNSNLRCPVIIGWWRKAGFLPMARNSLLNPKVRYELGDGGAPEEEGKRLKFLKEAYV